MKSITSTILSQALVAFCLLFGLTQTAAQGWERMYDITISERYTWSIPTQDGGVLFAGRGKNSVSGPDSLLIALRVDTDGDEIWRKVFSLPGAVGSVLAEQLDDGSFAIFYGFTDAAGSRFRLRRLDAWGNLTEEYDLSADPFQTYAWIFWNPAIAKSGRPDHFILTGDNKVLEVSISGEIIWESTLPANFKANAVIKSQSGDYLVSGNCTLPGPTDRPFLSRWDPDGQLLWQHIFQTAPAAGDFTALGELPDGNIILSAEWVDPTYDYGNIIKTDAGGNPLAMIPLTNGTVTGLVILPGGEGFVVIRNGFSTVGSQPALRWYDTELNLLSSQVLQTSLVDSRFFKRIVPAGDGGFFLMGALGSSWTNRDFLLVKTNEQGELYSYLVQGRIVIDENSDCNAEEAEPSAYAGFVVQLTDGAANYYGLSGHDGTYSIAATQGNYDLSVHPLQGSTLWSTCTPAQMVLNAANPLVETDIPIKPAADCPEMEVRLYLSMLRVCSPFIKWISVRYQNIGTATAANALVNITLPTDMELLGSTVPVQSQNGQTFNFELGEVLPGQFGQFSLNVQIPCDLDLLGQIRCVEAHIFPDSVCAPALPWAGSMLEVESECPGETARFSIRNTGSETLYHLEYVLIKNASLEARQTFQLEAGQEISLEWPGEGAAWHLRVQQTEATSISGHVSTILADCGDNAGEPVNPEFAHWFPNDDVEPFRAETCRTMVAAYDPNDKQASPLGYGEAYIIEAGTRIDYRIRFQNTGNDTAFLVVLRDTLSPWLDPATFRSGASSHPCRVELSGQGILKFIFDNIMLPDSATNEAASSGFVEFSILPRPDAPLGAEIFNSAAIYFDFNPPIFTNSLLHTIGEFTFSTQVVDLPQDRESILLKVFPNPAHESAHFDWEAEGIQSFLMEFWNASGPRVRQYRGIEAGVNFRREGLPSGVYFYQLRLQNGKTARGKLLLR